MVRTGDADAGALAAHRLRPEGGRFHGTERNEIPLTRFTLTMMIVRDYKLAQVRGAPPSAP